jgi:DNA-binding beta-propeller fold protein YncE
MSYIWTILREWSGRSASFFSAVILLFSAAIGATGHAQTVIATVPVGSFPEDIAVNPVTNKIYVPNEGGVSNVNGTVTVIDGATNATTTVTVGEVPDAVAVDSVTNKIYVANYGNLLGPPGTSTVSVIDGVNNDVIATVSTGRIRKPNKQFDPRVGRPTANAAIGIDVLVIFRVT